MFKKINYSKINKSKKITTVKESKTESPKEIKQKVNKYDVIFDLNHLSCLLSSDDFYTTVPQYLNKFFFKYGTDVFFDNGETFQLYNRTEAKKILPSNYKKTINLTKDGKTIKKEIYINTYFDTDLFLNTNETRMTIDYDKEIKFKKMEFIRGFEVEYNYLNMRRDLPRDYKKEITITKEIKEGVDMFFNHIKESLCSGYINEYEVVKKFFAASSVGHKLKFALFFQTLKEQTGKGTVLNTLLDIFGERMYKTASSEEVTNYNKNFEGRTLINLDEVPVAGSFKTYQDIMKSLITEPTFTCRQMHRQPYTQKNTFNLVLCSQNNAVLLSQQNNVRYYVPTTSNKYAEKTPENKEYFDKLHGYIKKEEVKIAIFQEFVRIYEEEIKPINWIGNDIGSSKAGQIKIIEALPQVIKFIKKEYLFEMRGIDTTTDDFILEYELNNPRDKSNKSTLGHYLGELGIERKRVINKDFQGYKYLLGYEKLKENFLNKNWLTDEEKEDIEIKEKVNNDNKNPFDNGVNETNQDKPDYKKENEELKKKLKELEDQIKLLQNPKVNEISPLDYGVESTNENEEISDEDLEKELQSIVSDNSDKKPTKPKITIIDDINETIIINSSDILDLINDDIANMVNAKKTKKSKK